jgi:YegS/Rv2252/BmrU family lipid kinase
MESRRPFVVVNPRSGGGRAGRHFGEVRAALERKLGPVDVAITDRPEHAIELSRSAVLDGRTLLVAVGGDGTLHEVLNGVLDASGGGAGSVAVGYVGQGTGGDFRRTLGLDHSLEAYVAAIGGDRTRRLDAGKLRYRAEGGENRTRWFINILSAGLGGLVDRYVSQTTRAFGGRAAYAWASARAILACPRVRLRCESSLAGKVTHQSIDAMLLAICNGRYFGSGMHVAPMAEADDGRFEVISMDAPNKLAFLRYSQRIYDGKHLSAPGVRHFACDRIAIDLENEGARDVFLLDVDGEPLGGLPLEVEIVPKAVMMKA